MISYRQAIRLPRPIPVALAAGAALVLGGCDEKIVADIDDTPPEATIRTPAADAVVSGVSFVVEVDASDDTAVETVSFRVSGGPPVTDDDAPWGIRVLTIATDEDTELTIEMTASDAAGNTTTETVAVTVAARTLTQLTTDPNDDMHPAWSPDGTRLAFQADRDGGHFDVWTVDADGSGALRLTSNVNEDRNPAWSPDGGWIAFDSDRAGNFDVWRMPIPGGEAQAVTVTTGNNDDIEPAWTSGGIDLWFASNRGDNAPFNLWRQPVLGSDSDAVSETGFDADDRAPALSPDGDQLAFGSDLNFTTSHVYVRDVGAIDVETLTGDVGFEETDPSWLPDAALVAFARSAGSGSTIWIQPVGGSSPVQVTFGAGLMGDGGPAWSPDGAKLAFHSDRSGNFDLWVLE